MMAEWSYEVIFCTERVWGGFWRSSVAVLSYQPEMSIRFETRVVMFVGNECLTLLFC